MTMLNQADNSFGFSGPLYTQVAAYLRTKITTKEWTPAAALPNEASLAKLIGVSIGTVRKAYEILEDERLVERRQGRGTFVVDYGSDYDNRRFSVIFADCQAVRPEVMWFQARAMPASPRAAASLGVARGAPTTCVDLIWRSRSGVRATETITVADTKFPNLPNTAPFTHPCLFSIYRQTYNVVISRVTERIAIIPADAILGDKLGVPIADPILHVNRLAFTRTGERVEWSERHIFLGQAEYCPTDG